MVRLSPLLGCVALALVCPADVFVLTDGVTVEGLLIEKTQTVYRVRLDTGDEISIPLDAVASVQSDAPSDAAPPAAAPAADDDAQKLIKAAQGRWSKRIAGIRTSLLDSTIPRLSTQGRERILAIDDPLAVLPLTRELSRGKRFAREVLVEVLSRFDSDEATGNLCLVAMMDGEAAVRRRAVAELQRRADPRVIPQLRRAVQSDSDGLVRNAAEALGALKAQSAVPELIDALTAERVKAVEVPVQRYFADMAQTFSGAQSVLLGDGHKVVYTPELGVGSSMLSTGGARGAPVIGGYAVAGGSPVSNADSEVQVRKVTMFRTEVLDALRAITGQNLGFEAAEWRRWYEGAK